MRLAKDLLCAFFFLILFCSFSLSNRLFEAKPGSYVVTEQNKHYSLLLLRNITEESILFEEISIPTHKVTLSTINWSQWVSDKAPGHSSWIQYEIDPSTLKLMECYSFSQKGWLYLDESSHFLSKLLSLHLAKTPIEERRKVGTFLKQDEPDQRPLWNPSLVHQGQKKKFPCESWKTSWPKDDSLLSSCELTIYLPSKETSPFPLWIEATNGHFRYSIQAINFGSDLQSPIKASLPRRPPQFLKTTQKTSSAFKLFIKSPVYYKQFSLFAFDILEPEKQIGPIPFKFKSEEAKETGSLEVSLTSLNLILQKNHRYKWILSTKEPASFVVESEDLFLWNCGKIP